MTEQPKFQRRKRRGPVQPSVSPKADEASAKSSLDALLAEKEALLQRKAQLEAKRLRQELETLESEVAQPAESDTLEMTPEQQIETPAEPEAEAPKPKSRPKPSQPLVLAQAPKPVDAQDVQPDPQERVESAWQSLDRFPLDPTRLANRNVITALRRDPAHARFDILRTRMLQALAENGWRRVAITSPTKDCGKTFTAANLAVSLSRQENCRAVLLDLDMRSPSLHKIFGVADPGVMGDLLREEITPDRHLQGFGKNDISAGSHVAIGFNGMVEPYASELLQDPCTDRTLKRIEAEFDPDVMLFDLPPALLNDDVIAMRPNFDALLIVAAGGVTRAKDIKEPERRLGDSIPLLGVVLNKAEDADESAYAY